MILTTFIMISILYFILRFYRYRFFKTIKPWDTVGVIVNDDIFNTTVVKKFEKTILVHSQDKKSIIEVHYNNVYKASNND